MMVRNLIGKPWAVPCDPPETFDCWELVRYTRSLCGLYTPSMVDRELRKPRHRGIITYPPDSWSQLPVPVQYCVVRMGDNHVGVLLDADAVLHCQMESGVRLDRLSLMPASEISFWEYRNG